MAYQNSIDMTVEIFKGLYNRVSSNTSQALTMFSKQKKLFSSLHNNIGNAIIKRIPQDLEDISGIPGTQKDAIELISNLTTYLFQCGNCIHNETNMVIDSTSQNNVDSSTKLDQSLNDMCSIYRQIDSIKKSMKEHDTKLQKKITKYQKSISNVVCPKSKIKKSTDVIHLLEKIQNVRKKHVNRSDLVSSADKCMNQISDKSNTAIQLMKQQCSIKKEIISKIINSNQQVIIKCDEVSKQVMSSLNKINFQKDFQGFLSKNKIIRYDVIPDEFKPLDFSHECFSNISTISKILSLQLYPYAMARAKKDFIADDRNELSIQKGKMILLMEDLNLPWVFIQNPYTKSMGYAPSSFFELIGNGLGVILNNYQTNDEILHKGDYIAIIGYSKAGSQAIHTISDLSADIPETMIGIISEF